MTQADEVLVQADEVLVQADEVVDELLVMTIPEAGKLLGLSRNGAYEAAKRGEIPVLPFGRLKKVPIAKFKKMFGAE